MTLDEARLLAGVNHRAQRLYQDGYRCRFLGADTLEVRSGQGARYEVDLAARTCTCPFYGNHAGRLPCKHALGASLLVATQRASRRLVALVLLLAWADLDDGGP